jgi:hypothetical protein
VAKRKILSILTTNTRVSRAENIPVRRWEGAISGNMKKVRGERKKHLASGVLTSRWIREEQEMPQRVPVFQSEQSITGI